LHASGGPTASRRARSEPERCRSFVGRLGIDLKHLLRPSTFLHSFAGPIAVLEVAVPLAARSPGAQPAVDAAPASSPYSWTLARRARTGASTAPAGGTDVRKPPRRILVSWGCPLVCRTPRGIFIFVRHQRRSITSNMSRERPDELIENLGAGLGHRRVEHAAADGLKLGQFTGLTVLGARSALLAALLMIAPNPRRSNSSGGSDPSTGSSVRFAIIHRRLRRSSSHRFTTTRSIR
jgi:hypothetical protein